MREYRRAHLLSPSSHLHVIRKKRIVTTNHLQHEPMKALFIELPPFERYRTSYLDDEAFRNLQQELLANPQAGDVIKGTGGLRKMRFADEGRGKGKRGGVRVIYYWWLGGSQYWLFTLYNKDEATDLTEDERKLLAAMLKNELDTRGQ